MLNETVVHKNSLAMGKFEDFELREFKLFLTLLSQFVEDKKEYLYNAKEIRTFIKMGRKSYSEFEKLIINLQKKIIKIKENDDLYETYNIYSKLKFDLKNQTILLKYNSEFIPFLNNCKNNFCKYKLKNIEPLTSKYSIIFYILSKSNLFKGKYILTLPEIEEKIGKKLRSDNIDKRVLNPVLDEINQFTDINLSVEKIYETQQRGRSKLIGYTFYVSKKEIEISQELEKAIKKAKKNIYILKSKVLNKETIQILLDDFSEEKLIKGLNFAYKNINKDFKALQYLKTIIGRCETSEIAEIEELEEEIKNDEFEKNKDNQIDINILDLEKEIFSPNKELEKEIIDYAVEKEKIEYNFLMNMKIKNKIMYLNTLKNQYQKMKKAIN
ncbi:MAG: replication initiation protein [Cetobacterium sp.]|nr:replication initiation protein [Cetobacterium sp.]